MAKFLMSVLKAVPITLLVLLILNNMITATTVKYKPSSRLISLVCAIIFIMILVAFIVLV